MVDALLNHQAANANAFANKFTEPIDRAIRIPRNWIFACLTGNKAGTGNRFGPLFV